MVTEDQLQEKTCDLTVAPLIRAPTVKTQPFANGHSGNGSATRGPGGRFLPGNKAAVGHGNPHASQVNAWRRAFVESVTAEDRSVTRLALMSPGPAGAPRCPAAARTNRSLTVNYSFPA